MVTGQRKDGKPQSARADGSGTYKDDRHGSMASSQTTAGRAAAQSKQEQDMLTTGKLTLPTA
jgi:hypothetical protein